MVKYRQYATYRCVTLNSCDTHSFPHQEPDSLPIDVSDGRVDCDSGAPIIWPQHIGWENIVIVHDRINISLARVH